MSVRMSTVPDLARSDVGAVRISSWRVGTPERQKAAVEAMAAAWQRGDWPDPGLLSYSVYTSNDGETLLHYTQWASDEAFEEFLRTRRAFKETWNAEVDAAVPGIERLGLHAYELYRSGGRRGSDDRTPGCVVIVEVEFDGPDAARQRAWVDAVFAALASDPHTPPGGMAAHFHTGTDGTRVVNYAEWESEQAHKDALEAPGDGVGSRTEQWERVQRHPGLRSSRVTRYTPALSMSAGV
ncbi:antibiotic biosynthesis monooxygenase [Streptomyces sp. NPDC057445]|uniref:antibiotic biosynthesis monooxygenase n=1 Tax=Streptomyces sp. NPDC057445 TaxID=3346136 RepID=UPI0036A33C79